MGCVRGVGCGVCEVCGMWGLYVWCVKIWCVVCYMWCEV